MVDRHTHNTVLDHYEQTHHAPPMSAALTDPERLSWHMGAAMLTCAASLFPVLLALLSGAPQWLAAVCGGLFVIGVGVYGVAWRGWVRFPLGLAIAAALASLVGYYLVTRIDLGYW